MQYRRRQRLLMRLERGSAVTLLLAVQPDGHEYVDATHVLAAPILLVPTTRVSSFLPSHALRDIDSSRASKDHGTHYPGVPRTGAQMLRGSTFSKAFECFRERRVVQSGLNAPCQLSLEAVEYPLPVPLPLLVPRLLRSSLVQSRRYLAA
ncbi:uncharacterized protein J3D65DRAFT_142481 [Phyllosticta citribraziliensis]|uniref:Uncharacterized protein n=1 Tax=Phyllosticta citribraziliensis TaxID=989973 RepID=A0ABR1L6P9_9PEZI